MSEKKTRNTVQRDLILDCLSKNSEKHLSADDVIDLLKSGSTPVGKATVYRFLKKLAEEGKIRRYTLPGRGACYQLVSGKSGCLEHYHLKCNNCGEVIHAKGNFFDPVRELLRSDFNFDIDISRTVIYGRCKNCEKLKGG